MTSFLRDDIGYLGSRYYSMSLIEYPNGNHRTNDIDFVSVKNNYLLFGETKMFIPGKDEIWIDYTKFSMLKQLAEQLDKSRRKIFLVGTDSYDLTSPTDKLWAITIDSVLSDETPSLTPSGNIVIHKDNMIPYTREEFSDLGNRLLDYYGCTTTPITSNGSYAMA